MYFETVYFIKLTFMIYYETEEVGGKRRVLGSLEVLKHERVTG